MAALIYTGNVSLDGYTVDADGSFDWAAPTEEVHQYINDLERPHGTYLYGRRMYETMRVWQTWSGDSDVSRDYAEIWRAAEKVVYSRTLTQPTTPRTRIEREFDPDAVRALKASATADLSIGGSELAAAAFAAGLVDEIRLNVNPVVVGGGARALPDGVRCDLELIDERRFDGGAVALRYRIS
jgi:dihydrofolate reductase